MQARSRAIGDAAQEGAIMDEPSLFTGPSRTVVTAVLDGDSCRAVAARFKVSVASVVKWSQRYRATGSVAAKAIGWRGITRWRRSGSGC